ncbi:MAG: ABC transporter substrate-binding protein [Actinomycetota bacterium]
MSHDDVQPRMPSLSRLLAMLLALALVAAACGSDDESADSDTAASGSETAEEDASASASASETAEDASASASASETAGDDTSAGESAGELATVYPLTISDAYGTEFTFEEPPRIGCGWYGCVEAGAELGVPFAASIISEEEAASAFYSRAAPEVFISDFLNPEEWAAADVDVVFVSPANIGQPDFEPVSQVVPVFALHYDNFVSEQWPGVLGGYEAYQENIRLIGTIMDRQAEAEEALARFDAAVENLAQYATPETAEETIGIIGLLGYASLASGSALCQVLNEAGHGTCVGTGVAEMLNAEAFLALNPDFVIDTGDPAERDTDPIWPQLAAVQNDNFINFETNRFYCCSTLGLILASQEYVHKRFPDAGMPNPGPNADFDPRTSPLVTG